MGDRSIKGMILAALMGVFLFLMWPFPAEAAVKTGGIDIGLECYEETESGKREPFQKIPSLMPNEQISYVVNVQNRGSDAWIRLLVEYEMPEKESVPGSVEVDDSWLTGILPGWVRRGKYWYYTKPLEAGAEIDFCKGICVPDFTDLPNGLVFRIYTKAEAIQAAHIVPDFQSEDPFSGILIEGNAVHSEEDDLVSGFEIRYENGADTVVKAEGLFGDVNELMPGDVKSGTVTIENRNAGRIQVCLKEAGDQIDDFILKSLKLTIRRNGNVLYDGAFADNALKNGVVLGTFKGKSSEKLSFELSLPKEVKNDTAFQNIKVAFVFSAQSVRQDYDGEKDDMTSVSLNETKIYPCPDPSVTDGYSGGHWKLIDEESHRWEYWFEDGTKAKDGWLYLFNPYSQDENKNNWFCFNEEGIMQYGWIKTENENWYFCHEISDGNLGKLKRGWHHDLDDKRDYYLDPVTGIMQTGWRQIDGQYYYFTPLEKTMRQNWFWNTEIGRWLYDFLGYRTYGSMFRGERTPDGYYVDEDGVWDGQEKERKEKDMFQ